MLTGIPHNFIVPVYQIITCWIRWEWIKVSISLSVLKVEDKMEHWQWKGKTKTSRRPQQRDQEAWTSIFFLWRNPLTSVINLICQISWAIARIIGFAKRLFHKLVGLTEVFCWLLPVPCLATQNRMKMAFIETAVKGPKRQFPSNISYFYSQLGVFELFIKSR